MSDVVPIIIINSSDSRKIEIEISLSSSLNTLKDTISSSEFGPVDRDHQRLFHLGRELKSGGRSLSTLGLGKFDNFLLHLHSTQPKPIDLSTLDEDSSGARQEKTRQSGATKRNMGVIDLVDDDADDADDGDVEIIDNASELAATSIKRRRI